MSDGRRARGDVRRAELVQAALEVIGRDGIAGLTHRAVAAQAGVALASASYHFTGMVDLAETALTEATRQLISTLASDPRPRTLGLLAEMIAAEVRDQRGPLIADYELYLLAIRKPELRAAALSWIEVIADTFAPALAGAARRAFIATVDGLFLHALFDDAPPDPAELEAALTAAWPS